VWIATACGRVVHDQVGLGFIGKRPRGDVHPEMIDEPWLGPKASVRTCEYTPPAAARSARMSARLIACLPALTNTSSPTPVLASRCAGSTLFAHGDTRVQAALRAIDNRRPDERPTNILL
jgi:hypothetical protein